MQGRYKNARMQFLYVNLGFFSCDFNKLKYDCFEFALEDEEMESLRKS